ncbi:MFS transporter [Francisella tularensis subsp. novicida]|uniref:MFS transporter n=2 Tax=Francisella tularensis TaxID=263 RepID=A0A6I4RR14_FRATU|nr:MULTISPECIES: MFS transporter [Francisella]ABK89473.1 major facilitator superfamily (MFS) transport protein [Francisella tularensis subsp. novicida U112]AJI61747.1 major Facilitator Superfamily protein [Francisella tularensis subsp. novicida U112]APC96031.1 major Facilitator Superfamily protein [Francisella tularensis subsp. novicida]EDX19811.1 transporter, major facilitator family [Francisella tularensis subsp. novicida FTE]MBK2036608.1 MFS transporter [Francisella tularensis subsp. novici
MLSYFKARSRLFSNSAFSYACVMTICNAVVVGIAYISISWHLLSLRNSIEVIMLFMFTWWIFAVLLSPLTGYFADLVPRKLIIILVNISRVLLLLAFIFLGNLDSLSLVYLFTAGWGIILAFFMPAMMIMSRELFANDDVLLYANSTVDGLFEFGMVIGMSLGGVLVAYLDMHQILMVMLIGSLLATLCSFKIIPKRNVKNTKISFLRNWQEVISFLNQNKTLYWCYLAQIGMTCLYMIAPVFISPYAKNILKASSLEFGLIEVAFSVGFIVGNVLLPYMIEKISPKQTLVFSMTISALMYLLLGLNESIFFASIYYLVAGIFISAWVIIVTIAQKNTPITLQGKIQGICYGFSGLVVMFIYVIFFAINYLYPLPSNKWFYILAILAVSTLWPISKGLKILNLKNKV